MKLFSILIILLIVGFTAPSDPPFREVQKSNYTVAMAFNEKWEGVKERITALNIDTSQFDMYIRVFKFEEDLEVWVKSKDSIKYNLFSSYKFCANVGELGPKRKEGDKQIPEGAYRIVKFNPNSAFHLSLKVNYPNKSDSILGYKKELGGQIFIHGGCSTIGCIPITDYWIKEVYILAVQAYDSGVSEIPVHIFPARLTNENVTLLYAQVESEPKRQLWTQLSTAYTLFEERRELPSHLIDAEGRYLFY